MFNYGITFKSGHCNVYESKKDMTELLELLNSNKWVSLKIKGNNNWITSDQRESIDFAYTMMRVDEIETIEYVEVEQ